MRQVVMYGPGDVRVEDRPDPEIIEQTDAIIRLSATCICGSDLWPYRGAEPVDHQVMGHEYVGVVEQIGADVRTVKVGDFVVGSFWASDNTCEICRAGYQSRCVHAELVGALGTQAQYARIPLADGTLVATPESPADDLIPSLLTASDVLGTGWFGAVAAEAGPGKTVVVVGDGAVGLHAVLAAKRLGADRIIAMSRHADRQKLALEYGATDIVTERGDEGVAKIKELTGGLGAHSVIEAVGTQESMMQAIHSTRPGGHVGYVGVSHGVELPGMELFFTGDFIDAAEAQRLGIVNQVFPDASFRDDVQAVAAGIAKAPPLPVSLMKRALRVSLTNDLAANLDLISSHYGIVTATDEHKDAVRRFVAKQ
jgi:threonine dehydrogenase-like Zn-dependent dehydrogenase